MANEILNEGIEPMEGDNTMLYIAMKKKTDGFLMAATESEYDQLDKRSYNIMGVIIRNEEEDINLLVKPVEEAHFFGDGPADIPETDKRRKHYVSPTRWMESGEQTSCLVRLV